LAPAIRLGRAGELRSMPHSCAIRLRMNGAPGPGTRHERGNSAFWGTRLVPVGSILGVEASMATGTLISVSEYLSAMYRPDCDYVDGEVQERNLGEYDHGKIQLFLGVLFYGKRIESVRTQRTSDSGL